ncbi:MAG TPA: membrane protein insertion efficiency factor YidD [Polyangiaceae bacterium]
MIRWPLKAGSRRRGDATIRGHAKDSPPSEGLVLAQLLIFLIRVYQETLSRLLGPVCRFEPSCSRYAISCLEHHGAVRGSWLALRRLLRCHPFHPGGYDPPPLPARRSSAGP